METLKRIVKKTIIAIVPTLNTLGNPSKQEFLAKLLAIAYDTIECEGALVLFVGLGICRMKWVTRIPTHGNDGILFSPDQITAILSKRAREFGGVSLDGPGRGVWIGSDGTVYDEPSYSLSVACSVEELPIAREMVRWIGKQLQQEAMYFEIQDSPVEIIRID